MFMLLCIVSVFIQIKYVKTKAVMLLKMTHTIVDKKLYVCVAYIFLFWIVIWPLCGKATVRLAFR